jgi:ketosteroid isomerase-like protein
MKFVLVFIGIFGVTVSFSQSLLNSSLQSMIDAERSFARLANDSNTRLAFLTYLANDAVTFGNKTPQNGKLQYEKAAPNESLLVWEPIFAGLSLAGDLGFDTGPWYFKKKRTDETPSYFGEFISVWKKQIDGKWKLALDLGISHSKPLEEKYNLTIAGNIGPESLEKGTIPIKDEIMKTENNFIKQFQEKRALAYSSLIFNESRFFRSGEMPFIGLDSIHEMLNEQDMSKNIEYTLIDGNISSSGDLGYVYGTITIKSKLEKEKTSKTCYQRIWKKEEGKWKIIIDVIGD